MNKEIAVEYRKVDDLIPYENNPRKNDDAVRYVANSIEEFGFKVPIVVDSEGVIVAGHTRLKAAKLLNLDEVPVIVADDLTEEQVKAFRLADNKVGEMAEWDFGKLELEITGMDIPMEDFGFEDVLFRSDSDTYYYEPVGELGNLRDRFVVPPFSVLDARQGYWRDRKKWWLSKTGDLSETRDGEYGKTSSGNGTMLEWLNGGTSNFDPVLAECMFTWFARPGAKVLDPFGGEQTKGVVAGELGLEYVGIEIREEQVRLNREKTKDYPKVRYFCGDSNELAAIVEDRDFDMCFTSPPYYDLEIYSKADMSALPSYDEFMLEYRNIFRQCYEMLKDDSFLVVKVGEIRDKNTGVYRSFVADNIHLLTDLGFKFYNDIVLVTAVGTAQLRATRSMRTRKVVKTHQNVLVFYKGEVKNISEHFPAIDFDYLDNEDNDE